MKADPAKAQVVKVWPSPRTVKEVKSLLQTLQYNAVYMAAPLRHLTKQQVKFKCKDEMEKNFQEIIARFCGDRAMVPYDRSGRPGCEVTQAQREPRQQ